MRPSTSETRAEGAPKVPSYFPSSISNHHTRFFSSTLADSTKLIVVLKVMWHARHDESPQTALSFPHGSMFFCFVFLTSQEYNYIQSAKRFVRKVCLRCWPVTHISESFIRSSIQRMNETRREKREGKFQEPILSCGKPRKKIGTTQGIGERIPAGNLFSVWDYFHGYTP